MYMALKLRLGRYGHRSRITLAQQKTDESNFRTKAWSYYRQKQQIEIRTRYTWCWIVRWLMCGRPACARISIKLRKKDRQKEWTDIDSVAAAIRDEHNVMYEYVCARCALERRMRNKQMCDAAQMPYHILQIKFRLKIEFFYECAVTVLLGVRSRLFWICKFVSKQPDIVGGRVAELIRSSFHTNYAARSVSRVECHHINLVLVLRQFRRQCHPLRGRYQNLARPLIICR